MCHPVAMTGSTYLHTQRTMTVPTAMLCAASNIHHSPLSQIDPSSCNVFKPSPASPFTNDVNASSGSSSNNKPKTPRTKPATPSAPSVSPNKIEAKIATVSGCESIITDPRPAAVRCNPSARNP
jgi:hypothetical protein